MFSDAVAKTRFLIWVFGDNNTTTPPEVQIQQPIQRCKDGLHGPKAAVHLADVTILSQDNLSLGLRAFQGVIEVLVKFVNWEQGPVFSRGYTDGLCLG